MKKIVIADDSATARMFIRRCLEIVGCSGATFAEAANGREALSILKAEGADFDLVMTDLNMPVMDGKTLLKWIKASPKLNEIPVVVATSAGNPAKEKQLLELGALGIVAKPVSPPALISVIGDLLETGEDQDD